MKHMTATELEIRQGAGLDVLEIIWKRMNKISDRRMRKLTLRIADDNYMLPSSMVEMCVITVPFTQLTTNE